MEASYRITVACVGLTESEGSSAVQDILEEFGHRPWNMVISCTWSAGKLRLIVERDDDTNGQALLDEFWDAIHACVRYVNPIRVLVESVS